MTQSSRSSYDEVPYVDTCHPSTHPDRLATLAAVHGLAVPPVERCRLLELGCARGGNLLPMALELPEATFVGVDLSERQIAQAREAAGALGIRNVDFRALSLADVDDSFGEFDFIVCHGVYSWVPDSVRDRILEVCRRNLAPAGLAYVSYNTFPGWSARGMVRDLVRFHARDETTPGSRVERARSLLEELAGLVPSPEGAYASILKVEAARFREAKEPYLLHEFFEDDNAPCSVREFLARAGAAGLEFVAEADTPGLGLTLPEAARGFVDRWAGTVAEREQYLDYVVNRAFRRTVLRQSGAQRASELSPAAIARLSVQTHVVPAGSAGTGVADGTGEDPVEFVHHSKSGSLRTNDPVLKAALSELAEVRPRALAFETLWERVRARLAAGERAWPRSEDEARETLQSALLRLFLADLVELHVKPPGFVTEVAPKPVGSPLARRQAVDGKVVTNLLRRRVDLDELARAVLVELDGTRSERDVLDAIVERLGSGELELSDGSGAIREERARDLLGREIRPALARLARMALLVA